MKKLIVLFLSLAIPALASGQTFTAVTANNVMVDNGSGTSVNPPSGSNLCFLGVNSNGAAITYTPAGEGPISGPICQTFTSGGNLSGAFQVANSATASPAGVLYTITITNGPTTYLTIPIVSVSGSLFNFGTYSVPGNGTVQGIGFPHIACNIGAQWTSTTIAPGASTCSLIGSVGAWISFPNAPYCPAGQGYITPQVSGQPFCISPSLTGTGAPTGSCLKNTTYFQQDAATGAFFWGCVNSEWQQVAGSGGATGLTSFQGRTTPDATLQSTDITGILSNSPFGLSGSGDLIFDSGDGILSPTTGWILGGGALTGTANFNLNNGSSNTISLNVNGSAAFAGGQFSIGISGVAAMAAGSTSGGSTICTTANQSSACPSASASFYQLFQNNAANLTQRGKANFITASGIAGTDNAGNGSTDIALAAVPNASLANSSITINVGAGLSGGGTIALGGNTTLAVTAGGIQGVLQPQTNCNTAGFTYEPFSGTCVSSSSGTVTTFSASGTQGVTTNVTNPNTTPSLQIGLGNITPTSVTSSNLTDSSLTVGNIVVAGTAGLLTNGPLSSDIPLLDAANSFNEINRFFAVAGAESLIIENGTAATSAANQNSPISTIQGNYWTGSGSAQDGYFWEDVLSTGANPTSTYTLTHFGSSGNAAVNIPYLFFSNGLQSLGNNLFGSNATVNLLEGPTNVTQNTPATSGTNQNSPPLALSANYWNGTLSVQDEWTWVNSMSAGTNPASILTLTHSGTPSVTQISIPYFMQVATLDATSEVLSPGIFASSIIGSIALGAATSSANFNSALNGFTGSYWNGSTAASDTFSWSDVVGTGTNPTVTATLSHTGSSGAQNVVIPNLNLSANKIVNSVGLQIVTATNCAAAPGSPCNITFTLSPAEPDTSYTVVGCNAHNITGSAQAIGNIITSSTSNFIAEVISLGTSSTGGGIVACMVTHN